MKPISLFILLFLWIVFIQCTIVIIKTLSWLLFQIWKKSLLDLVNQRTRNSLKCAQCTRKIIVSRVSIFVNAISIINNILKITEKVISETTVIDFFQILMNHLMRGQSGWGKGRMGGGREEGEEKCKNGREGKKEKFCLRKVRAAPRREDGHKTAGGKVRGGMRKRPTPCPPPNLMILSLEKTQ